MSELKKNISGHVHARSEKELKNILENKTIEVKREHVFAPSCIIDFYMKIYGYPILIEVKNWFVKIRDMEQIMKYLVHATEKYGADNFDFYLVAGGIDQKRREILEALNVKIIITKDVFQE